MRSDLRNLRSWALMLNSGSPVFLRVPTSSGAGVSSSCLLKPMVASSTRKTPEISTIKNSLQTVVKKDRVLNAVFAGGKSFIVSVSRAFYALWLQTTGLMFVFFTLGGAASIIRQYRRDHFADHQR